LGSYFFVFESKLLYYYSVLPRFLVLLFISLILITTFPTVTFAEKSSEPQVWKKNKRENAVPGEFIIKMKNDAAINADNDKKTREKVDKLNEADSVIFQTEKQLKEIGDKIPEDKKTKINEALTALKTAHQSQDLDLVTKELEILNQAWAAASQDIYQAQQNGNPQQESATQDQQSNSGKPDDTVTDIEYEDVKK